MFALGLIKLWSPGPTTEVWGLTQPLKPSDSSVYIFRCIYILVRRVVPQEKSKDSRALLSSDRRRPVWVHSFRRRWLSNLRRSQAGRCCHQFVCRPPWGEERGRACREEERGSLEVEPEKEKKIIIAESHRTPPPWVTYHRIQTLRLKGKP